MRRRTCGVRWGSSRFITSRPRPIASEWKGVVRTWCTWKRARVTGARGGGRGCLLRLSNPRTRGRPRLRTRHLPPHGNELRTGAPCADDRGRVEAHGATYERCRCRRHGLARGATVRARCLQQRPATSPDDWQHNQSCECDHGSRGYRLCYRCSRWRSGVPGFRCCGASCGRTRTADGPDEPLRMCVGRRARGSALCCIDVFVDDLRRKAFRLQGARLDDVADGSWRRSLGRVRQPA